MSENVIELEHVSFKYKGSEEGLLNDTSLKVTKGETLLLTGASGSGKTTILRLINGLIPHYYQGEVEGKVTVAGREIAKTELYELAGAVGADDAVGARAIGDALLLLIGARNRQCKTLK